MEPLTLCKYILTSYITEGVSIRVVGIKMKFFLCLPSSLCSIRLSNVAQVELIKTQDRLRQLLVEQVELQPISALR